MATKKALVLVYDGMSMSEITLLTDYLTVFQPLEKEWKIDTVGSKEKRMIKSEDSFQIVPNKSFDDIVFKDYKVIILSGIINPYPIAKDKELINFLKPLANLSERPLIAAISSAPMLLAKAGVLKESKFTSGLFEETLNEFEFLDKNNVVRQPVVYDKQNHIITAIGFAYREFAVKTAQLLGFDLPDNAFSGVRKEPSYTEEELTFFMNLQD